MKILKKLLIVLIIFSVLYYIVFDVVNVDLVIKKQLYPLKYEETIKKYSDEFNVDPILICSIIKVESNFNNDSTSHKGANGLMQIMDSTGKEVALKMGLSNYTSNILYDPEMNIMIGTKYISTLIDSCDGNELIAAAAYNAGLTKVKGWIVDGTINKDGSNLENIPYKETNNYIRKILKAYRIYNELYDF